MIVEVRGDFHNFAELRYCAHFPSDEKFKFFYEGDRQLVYNHINDAAAEEIRNNIREGLKPKVLPEAPKHVDDWAEFIK